MRLAPFFLILILVLVAAPAFADVKYTRPSTATSSSSPPEIVAAERAWAAAEAEKDRAKAVSLWEAAARAFDKAVPKAGKLESEIAYAAVLAWKNALAIDPRLTMPPPAPPGAKAPPMSDRDKALLKSLDVYIPLAPEDEVMSLHFLRANLFRRHDMFDDAVPIFEMIVVNDPSHETAEYSAQLLLDTLIRQGKFDRMADWVVKMRATPKLLAKRPDLVDLVNRLHVQVRRKQAEALELNGDFAACGEMYRDTAKSVPKPDRADELLFNAGVCFEQAGNDADAVKAFMAAAAMKTSLARNAKARAERIRKRK